MNNTKTLEKLVKAFGPRIGLNVMQYAADQYHLKHHEEYLEVFNKGGLKEYLTKERRVVDKYCRHVLYLATDESDDERRKYFLREIHNSIENGYEDLDFKSIRKK